MGIEPVFFASQPAILALRVTEVGGKVSEYDNLMKNIIYDYKHSRLRPRRLRVIYASQYIFKKKLSNNNICFVCHPHVCVHGTKNYATVERHLNDQNYMGFQLEFQFDSN